MPAPQCKYSRAKAELIIRAVREGAPRKVAAELAGITVRTLYNWIDYGKAGRRPFKRFAERLSQARAEAFMDSYKVGQALCIKAGRPEAVFSELARYHGCYKEDGSENDGPGGTAGGTGSSGVTIHIEGLDAPIAKAPFADPIPTAPPDPDLKADASKAFESAEGREARQAREVQAELAEQPTEPPTEPDA